MKALIFYLIIILFVIPVIASSQTLVPCWEEMPDKSKKWGFSDRFYSSVIIKCTYDSTYDFADGLAKIKLNGKYGYIDKTGKVVIPAKFDAADNFTEGFALVLINGRYQFIDKKGIDVFKKNFKHAAAFSEGAALVADNDDKAGYMDVKGNMLIPFSYKMALPFKNGLATVKEADKHWKVINKKGETVFDFPDNIIAPSGTFSEGFLPVTIKDNRTGKPLSNFLNTNGKLLTDQSYIKVNPFTNGRSIVSIENTERKSGSFQFVFYQMIDKQGKVITKKKYSCLEPTEVPGIYFFGTTSASTSNCSGYGLMDADGNELCQPVYSAFVKLSDTAFLCREAGSSTLKSYLVITTSGKTPIQIPKLSRYFTIAGKDTLLVIYSDYGDKRYQSIYNTQTGMVKDNVSEGMILLKKKGIILFDDYKSYGGSLITTNGKTIFEKIHTKTLRDYIRDDSPAYDDIPFLLVKKREDEGMRLYNTVTKKFVEGKYDFGTQAFDYRYFYSEGMLAVEQNRKRGFIDSTGMIKIPCRYKGGGTFHDGWANVTKAKGEFDDYETYVNKAGQEMPGIIAEDADDFFEGFAKYTVKAKEPGYSPTKLVYINKAGKPIFSSDVADVSKHGEFCNGMAAVCNKDGKYGYINTKGELVIPYKYDIPNKAKYTFYLRFDKNGFAKVEKDGKVITIDKTGKEY